MMTKTEITWGELVATAEEVKNLKAEYMVDFRSRKLEDQEIIIALSNACEDIERGAKPELSMVTIEQVRDFAWNNLIDEREVWQDVLRCRDEGDIWPPEEIDGSDAEGILRGYLLVCELATRLKS